MLQSQSCKVMEDGGVDNTVVHSRQHKMGQTAYFLLFQLLQIFTYSRITPLQRVLLALRGQQGIFFFTSLHYWILTPIPRGLLNLQDFKLANPCIWICNTFSKQLSTHFRPVKSVQKSSPNRERYLHSQVPPGCDSCGDTLGRICKIVQKVL